MKVTVYKKSGCPWAASVIGFLNELNVPFETKNVSTHPEYKAEIEKLSGQSKSPTLVIDGDLLPDAGVDDVAHYLEKRGLEL